MTGVIWCILDLFSNREQFTWSLWRVLGIVLIVTGKVIEVWVREELRRKAKFSDWISTIELQINQNHRLITTGLFKYIRHPLYSGVILQGVGWGVLSSSIYGSIFILIGLLFLIPRITIEENMLVDQFGEKYIGYQKNAKKLLPFIY